MSWRALSRVLAVYSLGLIALCVTLGRVTALHELAPAERWIVVSRWAAGKRIERSITGPGRTPPWSEPFAQGSTLVRETVTAEGALVRSSPWFELGLVAGRDGVMAELDGRTAFATADDLLAAQAYDHATTFLDPSLGMGTHRGVALHLLATDLGVEVAELERRARLRRVRFERKVVGASVPPRVTPAKLEPKLVTDAMHGAATYLARGVDANGRYRYLVDATTGATLPGYNWPRHAGTTFFLAQAAAITDDAAVRFACLRAAALLRDEMMVACGTNRCIADDGEADVGSAALALLAFTEIVETGADPSYRPAVAALARFLRAQQRPDGELMHLYDRTAGRPVDVQFLYFTGEAALALARAHRVTGDPEDLRAASRALRQLATHGWNFFGSRYYVSEEHWTCQAMSDLWERAPDAEALAFCLRWHEVQRRLQNGPLDSPFDADGAFGFGPMVTPRVTPAASRGEAAAAALDALLRDPSAGGSTREHDRTVALLDDELDRALAFVLRAQLRPGSNVEHLLSTPDEVVGGIPGSAVNLQLRIDYAQHAGSMMVRWLARRARQSR